MTQTKLFLTRTFFKVFEGHQLLSEQIVQYRALVRALANDPLCLKLDQPCTCRPEFMVIFIPEESLCCAFQKENKLLKHAPMFADFFFFLNCSSFIIKVNYIKAEKDIDIVIQMFSNLKDIVIIANMNVINVCSMYIYVFYVFMFHVYYVPCILYILEHLVYKLLEGKLTYPSISRYIARYYHHHHLCHYHLHVVGPL